MLRTVLPVAAALLIAQASFAPLAAQGSAQAKALHAAMAGEWKGVLRYRDYQDSTRFVSLPTLLSGTVAADSTSVQLAFTYDDGPGKTVRSADHFALDAAARVLSWGSADGKRAPSRFAVQSLTSGAPFTLVAEIDGEDDNRKARMRETITVARGELHILKEVQFAAGAPWVYRHEYRLARAGAPTGGPTQR